MSKIVEMDVLCETASALVAYLVERYTDWPLAELEVVADNGDIGYSDRVQTLFGNVLDILDDQINGETK